MLKIIVTTYSLFVFSIAYSQDSTGWKRLKIDDNLVVNMPGNVSRTDTSGMNGEQKMDVTIFGGQAGSCLLALVITPKGINANVDDRESLKKTLDKIAEGACKAATENGFNCVTSDTLIENVPSKKSKFVSAAGRFIPTRVNYTFLLNDKMYMFTIASFDSNEISMNSKILLNSIRITSKLKEQMFDSKVESTSYKIGYLIGKLIIPALVIGLIIYFVARRR